MTILTERLCATCRRFVVTVGHATCTGCWLPETACDCPRAKETP